MACPGRNRKVWNFLTNIDVLFVYCFTSKLGIWFCFSFIEVETIQNRPDGSGRADLDVRHLKDALHLRPLTDSRPKRHDEATHRSLLKIIKPNQYTNKSNYESQIQN